MCKNVFVIVLSEWSNSSNRPTSMLEKQAHSAAVIHQMHIFPFLWSWIKFEHFLFVHISLLRSNCSDMAVTSKTSSSSAINFWDPFFSFSTNWEFLFYRHLLWKIRIHHSSFCLISSSVKNVTLLTLSCREFDHAISIWILWIIHN